LSYVGDEHIILPTVEIGKAEAGERRTDDG